VRCGEARREAEAEVDRAAHDGVEKPAGWYKGVPGGFIREYSDALLLARLKAEAPGKYAERREARSSIASIDVTQITDEQRARSAAR
jgi:hypothetical protein